MSGRKEKKASGSGGKKPAEEQREQLLQAVVSAKILGIYNFYLTQRCLGTRGFVRKKNPPAHTRDSTSKDFSEFYISLMHSARELSFLCLAVSYSCSEYPSY